MVNHQIGGYQNLASRERKRPEDASNTPVA